MSNPTVGIDIVARLDKFREEMGKIPDIGGAEARTLAAKLSKEIKAAEAAAKKASDEMRKASNATNNFGVTADKVGSSAGKLAGALSLIAPGAGDAARNVADLADVGEVASGAAEALGVSTTALVATLGAVAVAVGAAYVAWQSYNEDAARAAVIAADVKQAHAAMQPILDAVRTSMVNLAVATGDLTTAEGQVAQMRMQAGAQFRASTEETSKRIAELRKEQASYVTQGVDMVSSLQEQYDWIGLSSVIFDKLTTSSADLEERIAANTKTISEAGEATATVVQNSEKAIRANSEQGKSARTAAAAIDAEAKAARELAEALAGISERMAAEAALSERNASTYQSVIDRLSDAADAARDARLEGEAKIRDSLAETLASYDELAREALSISGLTAGAQEELASRVKEAKIEAERTAAAEIDKIRATQAERDQAAKEADAEQNRKNAEEAIELRRQVASASSSLFGSMADAAGMLAESQSETNKEAALQSYKIQKALAITEATINTAVAISEAWTLGPAAVVAVPAAAAAGAVQIAAIASTPPPSFNDTPGVQMMGTRGNVSLAAGDYFAAARDPAELQRQVGAGGGGGVNILQVKLGHRVLDQSVARTIQQGGRLSRQINGTTRTRPTGHREA